jgi:hypothetical protein
LCLIEIIKQNPYKLISIGPRREHPEMHVICSRQPHSHNFHQKAVLLSIN